VEVTRAERQIDYVSDNGTRRNPVVIESESACLLGLLKEM